MAKNKIQDEKVQEAKRLININEDSRQYFYEKADETWLKWLWKNGFFDVLKKKAEDPSRFSYRTPELRYLVRMAELNPVIVTEIMLDIPISGETFNPEVIDQFLHICGRLPGEQIAKLTGKIKTENWPALMQMYNQWGMDYGKMFERLEKSGQYEEMVVLASAVLDIRDDWETKSKDKYSDVTLFCLANLSYSKVFYYLSKIDENYIEDAIDLSLSVLKKLTTLSDNDPETVSVFRQIDSYPLYDVDVFTIGVRSEYHGSGRDDVREVVALLKTLTERILTQHCKEKAVAIFEQNFKSLPDSWLMWRIRLFVLSLCPSELMEKLKESLFRIFEEDNYYELIKGAEYKKALMKAFPLMGKDDQSRFINLAKDLFSQVSDEEDRSSKKWDGSSLFSVIGENLSDDQVVKLVGVGFEINPGYVPTPMIGMGKGGFVKARGPINQEEFRSISVSSIVENLKGVWSPAQLIEQDVERDFLNPLNAEGMGKLLKEDVKTRIREYLEQANEFLDPGNLDLHYLYSLLSGFADAIEGNTEPLKMADWDLLIDFCLQIISSSKAQPAKQLEYEIHEHNAWLGRWNAVHAEMAKMLKEVLRTNGKKLGFEWNPHRQDILSIVEYLFDYPDPRPDDEQIDSAKMTESAWGQEPLVSDPFTLAINSIRGKAFELFVLAVELDRENYDSFESVDLSADLKRLYEYLLNKEETRAIMFMFGHYLPTFFFRDKNWLKSILNKIFPTDKEKEYLYLAAWEGYLTNNLYVDIFEDEEFQRLYKSAIVMTVKDYPHQKHFTDPDEGVAQHLALAYMFTDFGFGDDLFKYFWKDGIIDQHIAFVDRLGRSFVASQNPKALKLLREDVNAGRKLKDMWDWLLDNYSDPSIFDGIGFWINLDKGIFQANELASFLAKTLGKTDGNLKWDIGLQETIVALAQSSPEDTVEIARLYLLEGGVRKRINSLHFILGEKWIEAFRILYTQPGTKQATLSLINDLIREGGNLFWPLKEVLKSS
jgi:hypothetical protein